MNKNNKTFAIIVGIFLTHHIIKSSESSNGAYKLLSVNELEPRPSFLHSAFSPLDEIKKKKLSVPQQLEYLDEITIKKLSAPQLTYLKQICEFQAQFNNKESLALIEKTTTKYVLPEHCMHCKTNVNRFTGQSTIKLCQVHCKIKPIRSSNI